MPRPLISPAWRLAAGIAASIGLSLGTLSPVHAQTSRPIGGPTRQDTAVTTRASGTFDVKLNPLATYDTTEGSLLGRLSIDKVFRGDLEATGKGEMLSARTSVESSAGYVAIERVTGTLHGRSGSFVLQHSGTMSGGAQQLVISVVPDSGTGELVGLSGTMKIIISDGKHSYELEYTLAGVH